MAPLALPSFSGCNQNRGEGFLLASKRKPCSIDAMQSENDKVFYHPVPVEIARRTDIGMVAKMICGYLYGWQLNNKFKCKATNKEIAERIGSDKKTVSNNISDLRNAGILPPRIVGERRSLVLNEESLRPPSAQIRAYECPDMGNEVPEYGQNSAQIRARTIDTRTKEQLLDHVPEEMECVRSIDNRFYTLEEVRRSEAFTPTVKSAIEKIAGKYNLARIKAPVLRDLETYEATTPPEKILNLIDAYGDNHGADGLMKYLNLELF